MDFIDGQAEVSSNDGSSTALSSDEDEPKKKKVKMDKKKKKDKKSRRRIVQSSDEEEDEDDDDDRAAMEEMKGFIADDDVEEEADNKSEKSEKEEMESDLDEDDLELIQENYDIPEKRKNRIIQPEDSDDEDDRTAIQKNLFGAGGDEEEEVGASRAHQRTNEYNDDDDRSDTDESRVDDFIEFDGEEERRKGKHRKRDLNIPEGALDEARDVFGVEDFNFDEFYDEDDEAVVDEEVEDEMVDDEERAEGRIRRTRPKEKKGTLLDTMEPTDLDRGYLAPADKKIQLEDKPERFQLRRIPVTEADEEELILESKWIYSHAFQMKPISKQEDPSLMALSADIPETDRRRIDGEAPDKILEALRFIRKQSFEVPFIAFYRKEAVDNILVMTELWRVYKWDMKWCHLKHRKEKLLALMKRMLAYQVEGDETPYRMITEHDLYEVETIGSLENWTDISGQFNLFHASNLAKMAEWEVMRKRELEGEEADELDATTRFKQCSRKDKFMLCVEHGIGVMVARFGLTAKQFGENLDWKRHEVEQDPVHPMVAAEEHISTSFTTAADVINGAVYMLAKEISREPSVRARLRTHYRSRANISVRPTKQGREQMDDNHPIWRKRYIKEKPISEIEQDDYLYYHLGKSSGLLDVTLSCDKDEDRQRGMTLVEQIIAEQPFYKDEYTDVAEEWNKLRVRVVRMAIEEMLLPTFEQELHQKLLEEAKEYVIKRCAENMYNRLTTAAYQPEGAEDEEEDEEERGAVRVLGIVYATERDEVSFGAMVNQDGQVVDHLRLPYLMMRAKFPGEKRQKDGDLDRLKKFIIRRKPHVIAIAGENIQARYLKNDIIKMVNVLASDREIPKNIPVVIHDNEGAKVYMQSKMSETEHPDYPPNLRQAVSLARLLLDPLVEYAHLANSDDDIFCLGLHPLQAEVSKEDLTEAINLELINRVNEVGVDINKCVEYAHHANLLQFVCGLGPRKATHLMKTLRQNNNLLESRTRLVTLCKIGPKVFMNCAGFIKIDTQKVSERTESYVEVLDSSRVHPETYEWARKMAVDALEVDDSTDPTSALEEILQQPDRLRDLDLDAFAEELQRQNFGNKGVTLYDIRSELSCRYKDLRSPYKEPNEQELFQMLTKETPASMPKGKLVCGKVERIVYKPSNRDEPAQKQPIRDERRDCWRCPNCQKSFTEITDMFEHFDSPDPNISCPGVPVGVRIRLDNGIIGFIRNQNLSDHPDTFKNPAERVKLNQPIYCRILKVEPERFSCDLTCKSSDLQKTVEDFEDRDMFWDQEAQHEDVEKDKEVKERKQAQTSQFIKRVISHQQFHNVTYKDAERMLAKLDQGDSVIRPSSKSANNLTVTWKVADGIFQHIDIQEFEKEKPFTLGKRLMIGPEEFEDLEEILSRWIQPMASFARECISHKYFYDGVNTEQKELIEERLIEEKRVNPNRIPYCITPSAAYPGKFTLSYMVRTLRQEYMTMTPEGIRFRTQIFSSLDQLLNWFKLHFRDRPPTVHSSYR